METFCDNKLFFISSTQLLMFSSGFKAVNEPPVPQHVQRKEHVFQALTPEQTWDLNKNCIIVICDDVPISMRKSYNDMYTNKTVIQRNKVLSFHFRSERKYFVVKCLTCARWFACLSQTRGTVHTTLS